MKQSLYVVMIIFIFDDSTINLKEGYWVRDYNIDYENGVVTLNLDKD